MPEQWSISDTQDAGDTIEDCFRRIIEVIGDDPNRPGVRGTPERMSRAYQEMFKGYRDYDFSLTTFPSDYGGIVVRVAIPYVAYCEHHFAPFTGSIDFGYIPDGKVVGLSKIIRLFQHIASRLWTQEDMTDYMIDTFCNLLSPRGAIIVVSGLHSCESNRGVKCPGVPTITSAVRGVFEKEAEMEQKFYQLLNLKNK